MLPRPLRVSSRDQFQLVTRSGRRAARGCLVVHRLERGDDHDPSRAGIVVGRSVGNAVVRHRVSRQLRALLREAIAEQTGELIVVRAMPCAAGRTTAQLRADLSSALVSTGRRPILAPKGSTSGSLGGADLGHDLGTGRSVSRS